MRATHGRILRPKWPKSPAVSGNLASRTPCFMMSTSRPATPARARGIAVEWREISTLIPYARNPRTHSEAQVAQIWLQCRSAGPGERVNPTLTRPSRPRQRVIGLTRKRPFGYARRAADLNRRSARPADAAGADGSVPSLRAAPGVAVFVIALKHEDGKLTSARLHAEKDGIKPPM
jgi:hypothetical protein